MTYFYHSVVDSPHTPRDMEADTTQAALLTVLAEFWGGNSIAVPSAAIVEVMGLLGVSEAAVRAAISRLGKKGTLDVQKNGRRTSYRLSDEVFASIPASELLTLNFGARDAAWDGEWTVVVFSVPEDQRDRRQLLREWLRWLGFGPVRDGVWISPHADVEFTHNALSGVLPIDGLVLKSSQIVGEIDPEVVWSLGGVRAHYDDFIETFRPYVYRLRAGTVAPIEALHTAISILGRWRAFPTIDPDLPVAAMPADWRRREARRVFTTVYDSILPLAAEALRTVVSRYDTEAAAAVRVLSIDEAVEEYTRRLPAKPLERDIYSIAPRKLRQAVA
jgi:phenylacetic acid degradation operon negative regulatory protein